MIGIGSRYGCWVLVLLYVVIGVALRSNDTRRRGTGGVAVDIGAPYAASTSYDTAEDAKGRREKKNIAGRARRRGKIRSNGEALSNTNKQSMTYL